MWGAEGRGLSAVEEGSPGDPELAFSLLPRDGMEPGREAGERTEWWLENEPTLVDVWLVIHHAGAAGVQTDMAQAWGSP